MANGFNRLRHAATLRQDGNIGNSVPRARIVKAVCPGVYKNGPRFHDLVGSDMLRSSASPVATRITKGIQRLFYHGQRVSMQITGGRPPIYLIQITIFDEEALDTALSTSTFFLASIP